MSWTWIAGFLAPAIIMALVLVTRGPLAPTGFYAGTQGAVHLALVSKEGRLRDGAAVRVGEALSIQITTPKPGFLLVLGLDENRALTAYEPPRGTTSIPVSRDEDVTLPGKLVVAGAPGRERVYALFTEHPIAVEDVATAVHAAHTNTADIELPVHGAQSSVQLEKVVR